MRRGRKEHDARAARQLEPARVAAGVMQRDAAQLDVVLGQDAQLDPCDEAERVPLEHDAARRRACRDLARVTAARLEAERAAAEEATQRSEFLAFASRELGASLNLDAGMERLLQMLVPGLADYALLSVQLEDEALVMCCSGARARPQLAPGLEALDSLALRIPLARRYASSFYLCAS